MIAIDPGANPGFACFDEKTSRLYYCGAERTGATKHDTIVCEHPTIYAGGRAAPNHILELAITTGRLVERFSHDSTSIVWYLPRQWKGQLPKTTKLDDYVVYRRIMFVLDADEMLIFFRGLRTTVKKQFDVVDAVGIGLYHLKRFR